MANMSCELVQSVVLIGVVLLLLQTSLESKLGEFREENQLLGRLLQDAQRDKKVLQGRLSDALAHSEQQKQLLDQSLEARQGLELLVERLQLRSEEAEQELIRQVGGSGRRIRVRG